MTGLLLPVLLLFAAPPGQVGVIEETVRVPASEWRPVLLPLRQRPATVVCSFAISPPGSVRVALMTAFDLRRLEDGQRHRVLASTGFERAGGFRYAVRQPGDYALVLDNRLDARGPADVHLRVALEFGSAQPAGHMLSPGRRKIVIAISLGVFALIAAWSGRKLVRAMREQRTREQLPPSS